MIDEIYHDYQRHIEIINPIFKSQGIEKDINEIPLAINLDMETILTPLEIFEFKDEEIQKKLKEAYVEILKLGIYIGYCFGMTYKIFECTENSESCKSCLNESFEDYTDYELKIEFFKQIIPPIKIQKMAQEDESEEIEYSNKRFDDINEYLGISVSTLCPERVKRGYEKFNDEIRELMHTDKTYKDIFDEEECENEEKCINEEKKEERNKETDSKTLSKEDDEELHYEFKDKTLLESIESLKEDIRSIFYAKFFNCLGLNPKEAEMVGKNHVRFNGETAEEMFISPLFKDLEGEYSIYELVFRHMHIAFNEGMTIGILNGIKSFLKDLQEEKITYNELKMMEGREIMDYVNGTLD